MRPSPGASAARNTGWRAAAAPLVLFLDDDVLPEPQLVAEHLGRHARHPEREVGVLGLVRWADELRVTPFMRWLERGIHFDFGGIEGEEAGWGRFYTANVSVKRELLDLVGGFDEERLPFGYEDLDLAYRMHAHGFRLLFNRRACGEHVREMTLESVRGRMPMMASSERAFCAKHPEIEPYFLNLFRDAASRPPARAQARPRRAFRPSRHAVARPAGMGERGRALQGGARAGLHARLGAGRRALTASLVRENGPPHSGGHPSNRRFARGDRRELLRRGERCPHQRQPLPPTAARSGPSAPWRAPRSARSEWPCPSA